MFTPFWRLTRWGFIGQAFARIDGGDETHDSVYMVVPMVGEFSWFDKEQRIPGDIDIRRHMTLDEWSESECWGPVADCDCGDDA